LFESRLGSLSLSCNHADQSGSRRAPFRHRHLGPAPPPSECAAAFPFQIKMVRALGASAPFPSFCTGHPLPTTTTTPTTTSILASPGGISWLELFWGVGHIYISRPKIIFVDFRFFIDIWAQRHPHLNAQPLSAALSGRAGVTAYWGVLRPRAWRLRFASRGCLFLIGFGGLAFAMCR
jgi:hypothetical protein